MPEWDPQRTVDEDLARDLIGRHVTIVRLERLGAGWDNTVWLVNHQWAFRFPRREIALPGVEREIAVLPQLDLPLKIPRPHFIGEPTTAFPWPWFGAEYIRGRELPEAVPADDQRDALGRPLGEFLRALHAHRADLPQDPMGRADMDVRIPKTRAILKEAEPLWDTPRSIEQALVDATGLGPLPPTATVHGDLHARHILLHRGAISGVIDWGDVCRGDPCIDLALTWFALTPDGRADFFAAYGPVTEDQLLRARILAVFMCATLLVYGANERNDFLVRDSLAGLHRAS